MHFQSVFTKGRRYKTRFFHVIVAKANGELGKVAVACPKKVGKAHLRNKCKRRLKEAIRHYLNAFPQDRDCIFLATKYCQDTPLKDMRYHKHHNDVSTND